MLCPRYLISPYCRSKIVIYDAPQACFEGERVTPIRESTVQYLRPSRPSSPEVSTDVSFLLQAGIDRTSFPNGWGR
jgi:hypothetical protein